MTRRYAAAFVVLAFSCLVLSSALAQTAVEDARAKLRGLIIKKSQMKNNYEQETQKINRANDDRIVELKKQFHATRDGYITQTKEKLDQLKKNHQDEMRPVLDEERQLMEVVSPYEGPNFAKSKKDRDR